MTVALDWAGPDTDDEIEDLRGCLKDRMSDPEARSVYVAIDGLGLRECAADRIGQRLLLPWIASSAAARLCSCSR